MDTPFPTQPQPTSRWADFSTTYRREQVATILHWVAVGESGTVIGAAGTGKSNIAGYLANRPDVTRALLPEAPTRYCFLHLDAHSLPAVTTSNFYWGLLYTLQDAAPETPALHEALDRLIERLPHHADEIALYFTLQKAHDLLIQRAGKQVIWLIDRFDMLCQQLEIGALNSLRNLRDRFRDRLSYVVFSRLPLARLRNPREFDEFHRLVATHTCWVGAMNAADAEQLAQQVMTRHRSVLPPAAQQRLMELTGGWPSFLKVGCSAFANGDLHLADSTTVWQEHLLTIPKLQHTCQELWDDCTQTEKSILAAIVRNFDAANFDPATVRHLQQMGLLCPGEEGRLAVFAPIFTDFIKVQHRFSGQISLRNGIVYIGADPLPVDLAMLEYRLLEYLIDHAGKVCDKNEIIAHVWPDEKQIHGIRDDSLVQLLRRLRQKIEPADKGWVYIETIYGRGYRLNQPSS